jgi:hypothetical protein
MPMIERERRRLAGAVAPEQRHDLARGDIERHAVQTCDSPYHALRSRTARSGAAPPAPATELAQRRQPCASPMYASTTAGWRETCA